MEVQALKLYELAQNYHVLSEMLDGDDTESIKDTLEAIQESLEDKAENIAKLIKNIEGDITAIKEEEKRLADRRRAAENKINYLKSYLEEQMMVAGIKRIKRPTITIALQKNPPSLEIEDESKVPEQFVVPQPDKIDRRSLLAWIREGNEVSGIKVVQKEGLRIR